MISLFGRTLFLLCFSSFFCLSVMAYAPYVGVSGYWVDNNTDSGAGFGLRAGWHFPAPETAKYQISTDVEVEALYWELDSAVDYSSVRGDAETKVLPFLANLRVNVPLADTGAFFYGGGGVGVSWIGIDGSSPVGGSVDDTGAVFTYTFFVGVGGDLTDHLQIRAGYRALWLGDETFNDGSAGGASLDSEQYDLFELAIRYGF